MSEFSPLKMIPGVDTNATPLVMTMRWIKANLCRFYQGRLQQIGGWQRLSNSQISGICRGIMPWQDTSSNQYIAEGSDQQLAVSYQYTLYDVTPVSGTTNPTGPFQTASGQKTVSVTDTTGQAFSQNWINFPSAISVGGIILQGRYQVASASTTNNYTIAAATAATSSATGGTLPTYRTTASSFSVNVNLPNHGLAAGNVFVVGVSTLVGGATLYGAYVVSSVSDANNFTIIIPTVASSSASVSENGGKVQIQYLLGNNNASGAPGAYGVGTYGSGLYGVGAGVSSKVNLRQWSFGAWGSFLTSCASGGPIYLWDPSQGFYNNRAAAIPTAPQLNNMIFLAMPEQQLVSLGAQPYSGQPIDPLLIRWCDVADYTDWVAAVTNQAGSYRIPRGSRIVGGMQTSTQALIWTDIALWAMSYQGYPYVFGFNEIAQGCGLISQRAAGTAGSVTAWMSQNGFFSSTGGGVSPIECPVFDDVFGDLDKNNVDKIICAPNASFNEMGWFFPSVSGGTGECDSAVIWKIDENVWTIHKGPQVSSYIRTAWVDQSILGSPVGADLNSLLQQHEVSYSADGTPLVTTARTGWFKMSEGEDFITLERFRPDFKFVGSGARVQVTFFFAEEVSGSKVTGLRQKGPYYVTDAASVLVPKGRGRYVSVQFSTTGTSFFWRIGEPRQKSFPSGRRA